MRMRQFLRWTGHVARMECSSAFNILTGTPTGKRPSGKHRRRWVDNIRMDLTEIGVNTRNWVDSVQDKYYVSPSECGIEPPGSISHRVNYI